MRVISVFILLTVAVAGRAQTSAIRVSPDEAAKHLVSSPKPTYPPLAEQARIQGNVIFEIRIDESGKTAVIRLFRGHPMLAPAAIDAVKKWTYQPFEVNGNPTAVKTFVMVTFGNPSKDDADDRAVMAFENDFWTSEESAEDAIANGNFSRAEEQLNRDKTLLSAEKDSSYMRERSQWMTSMGRFCMAQKKFDEAEQFYKDALVLRERLPEGKETMEVGISLANLADLFITENKLDLGRDQANRSLAVFQKLLKDAPASNSGARQVYGANAARESLVLLQLAQGRKDTADIARQCSTLASLQNFLTATGRDSMASSCQSAGAVPR
jgi:TonB family protein